MDIFGPGDAFAPFLPDGVAVGKQAKQMGIRVIVIESHLMALEGILAKLDEPSDIEVVAALSDGVGMDDLLQLVRDNRPHLAILDLSLKFSSLDPFDIISTLRKKYPEVKIVVLVGREDGILMRWLVSHKVTGCLFSSDEQVRSLGAVVRKVAEGKLAYSQEIMERYFQLFELALTPRELEVLYLAGEGLSNDAIAKRLSVSPVTIRNHLSNVYAKLGIPQEVGVSPRVCAVNRVRRLGLMRAGAVMEMK
jgi:DNA-binding NarL/FixJ family response regulator